MSRLKSILGQPKRSAAIVFFLTIICSSSWAIAETGVANPKRGGEIYRSQCLTCHGENLNGQGPRSQYLKILPADLQSLSSRLKSDFELLVIIGHGVIFTPMHDYRDVLSEQDIRDLVAYIRTYSPFKPLQDFLQAP